MDIGGNFKGRTQYQRIMSVVDFTRFDRYNKIKILKLNYLIADFLQVHTLAQQLKMLQQLLICLQISLVKRKKPANQLRRNGAGKSFRLISQEGIGVLCMYNINSPAHRDQTFEGCLDNAKHNHRKIL